MNLFKPFVYLVKWIKSLFPKIRTYQIENTLVFLVLVTVALVSGSTMIEWIGVMAVFVTFNHAIVSNRLEEAEGMRIKEGIASQVACYKKQTKYFVLKEILWFAYFILLGAWSALAGVVIFLIYPLWRNAWRKY